MKLIADSGSTKTDWVLLDGSDIVGRCQTAGINPYHQSADAIMGILRGELCPSLKAVLSARGHAADAAVSPGQICFYGSGVRPEVAMNMQSLLRRLFPSAGVEVSSDLLAAARALFGRQAGIAAILGTGANSGLYDGSKIVENTPPLGYILGDEGSGAVLGRNFLNALYKGFIKQEIRAEFERDMRLDMADVISRVYRQPQANKFLASLAPFIARHLDDDDIESLVVDNFRSFYARNVVPYNRSDLSLSFVGSIACHFEAQLRLAASLEGFAIGQIMKSPIDGLVAYHAAVR